MRLSNLHHLLIGAAIALAVIVPLGAFAFVKSGIYDVAASRPQPNSPNGLRMKP